MTEYKTKEHRVTISDLAKASGYSKTAVSFAFNDPNRISKRAYEIIMEAATKIGYVPNPMARNLSLQRHLSIGLLLPQQLDEVMLNPYIVEILQGIGLECERRGYALTMIPLLHGSITDAIRGAAVDGLITLGMQAEMKAVDQIRLRKIPFVTIDGSVSEQMPGVVIDDERAAYEQMRLVLSLGHRRIALVPMPLDLEGQSSVHRDITGMRMNGYKAALAEIGLAIDSSQIRCYCAECTREEGAKVIRKLQSDNFQPTVVICMSDITAIGCMMELRSLGIVIPDTVSVVGFDGIDAGEIVEPPLTTVSQSGKEKGKASAGMLFSLIKDNSVEDYRITLPHFIIRRGSLCKRIP